jgi:hypothetical protein
MPNQLTTDAVGAMLAPFAPITRTIATAARARMLAAFPDAIETAEGKEFGYGFDRGYKGLVFTISLKKYGVNLGIIGGASMDDPDELLQGTGKLHRHVEILDVALLDDDRLVRLLASAVARRRANR